MISHEKLKISTPLQKLPKIRAIWVKLLLPRALKSCPKCNKSPNLVTLQPTNCIFKRKFSPSLKVAEAGIVSHQHYKTFTAVKNQCTEISNVETY